MHLLSTSLVVLLSTIGITALPVTLERQQARPRSFKVNAHRRDPYSLDNLERRNNGAVTVSPIWGGVDWVVDADIGGQTLRLMIDTGSADLWVFSTLLPDDQKGTHALYDPSKSSTWQQMTSDNFDINYSVFGASGIVGTDTVDIGGAVVPNMPFGVASNIGDVWRSGDLDGFLGLAFKYGNSIRPDQQGTFMEFVEPYLDQPIFTCNFRNTTTGTIEFGYVDSNLYQGELVNAPVNNQTDGSWTVDNISFSVGGTVVSAGSQSVLFDTGGITTLVNAEVASAFWGQVQGAQDLSGGNGTQWVFPCSSAIPDLGFNFGTVNGVTNHPVVVPGANFNAGPTDSSGTTCNGALASDQGGRGTAGDPFFKAQFVVFNQAEPSISVAEHNETWTCC